MTSRRDRDRPRYDDDDRNPPRRGGDYDDRGRDDPPRDSKKAKGDSRNEYFINGKGINREVLQREICYFLGPDAVSRPDIYKGIDGYMIKAVRPFTSEMLEDLIRISEKYDQENNEMKNKRGGRGVTYNDSRIGGQRATLAPFSDQEDVEMGSDDSHGEERRPTRTARKTRDRDAYEPQSAREFEQPYPSRGGDRYDSSSVQPVYGRNQQFVNPPPGNPYPGGRDPYESNAPPSAYSNYQPQTVYPPAGYHAQARPGTMNNYGYGSDTANLPIDPYGNQSIYSPAPGRDSTPRQVDPRGYPTRDPYEGRLEQPRYDYNPGPPAGRGLPPVNPYYGEPRTGYPSGPSRIDESSYDRDYQDNARDPYRAKRPQEESRRPRNPR